MVDTKYEIDDILNAVVNEKPVDLQAALNSIMVDKAHEQIAGMKAQLMQNTLGDVEPDEESEEDIDLEDIEDDEDDEDELEVQDEDEDEELDADELFNDLETDEDETDNQG